MEKKWIWLILFGVMSALGAYVWWTGGAAAPSAPAVETTKEAPPSDDLDAPVLGGGTPSVRPPGARGGGDPQSPFGSPPPPGYSNPSFEGDARPPDAPTFDPVPPQAFENPDFVTPPPPPTQFDAEPVPFDDEIPVQPPQNFENGGPPIDEFNNQPAPSPEGF